jgi:hypothetical protein
MCMVDEPLLRDLLARAPAGPRIEFGVFRGESLALIADHPGLTIGVDSFEGMAQPGPRDLPATAYPKGRLAAAIEIAAAAVPKARLVKGFVPQVLEQIHEEAFGFAQVDLDQYGPTLAALEWLQSLTCSRMAPGGIILCDDVFPGRTSLASGAVNDFCAQHWIVPMMQNRMAWWIVP